MYVGGLGIVCAYQWLMDTKSLQMLLVLSIAIVKVLKSTICQHSPYTKCMIHECERE